MKGEVRHSPAMANQLQLSMSESGASAVEDRSAKSSYVVNTVMEAPEAESSPANGAAPAVTSRMETYRADWAAQEASQPLSRPLLPQDVERWREEKARRMLAWINSSQLRGYWGGDAHWWKVSSNDGGGRGLGGEPPVEASGQFFDSLEPSSSSAPDDGNRKRNGGCGGEGADRPKPSAAGTRK